MCIVEFTGHLLSDRDTTSSTGMGAGVNGNNQWEWKRNWNKTWLNLGLGMGMGISHWEWEGMGSKKIFPLISSVHPVPRGGAGADHRRKARTLLPGASMGKRAPSRRERAQYGSERPYM